MKHTIARLLCILGLMAGVSTLHAQPAPRIYVVDMIRLFEGHYKTAETNARFSAEQQEATATLNTLQQEITAIETEYRRIDEASKNPTLKDDARAKSQADMQKLLADRQTKLTQGTNYRTQVEQSLQQRIQSFRALLLDEIGKVAKDVAVKKGATLLLDKSGVTAVGIVAVLHFDPAYDITDEVAAEIARTAPPPAPASAPAAAPAASPAATPAPTAPKQ